MVVQKTIDNLKERPEDERKVVAGGVAITVVAILFVGWAILFFKKIQSGQQALDLSSRAQDEFNFTSVREAEQQLQQYQTQGEDFSTYRDEAAAQQIQSQQELQIQEVQGGGSDQFGNTQTSY